MFSAKPLSMHEARLPQLSKEMMAEGRWLLPHSGGRPWLERPPGPHIVTRLVGLVTGRLDEVWIVRIPNVLAGTAVMLCCAYIGACLFGRAVGVMSALTLATMYEFYTYASQAEDDIFLAAMVAGALAMFVKAEAGDSPPARRLSWPRDLLGNRPPAVSLFFIFAGLCSLAKGPGVGAVQIAAATGTYVLLSGSMARVRRYLWVWGWLLLVLLTICWPMYAYRAYPSAWDNWKYDFTGPFGHEPPWYYAVQLLGALLPWTPLTILGLILLMRRRADTAGALESAPPRLFPRLMVACFVLGPVVVMSLASRKHHHYLVPVMLPWGIATAYAIARLGPGLLSRLHAKSAAQSARLVRGAVAAEILIAVGLLAAGLIVAAAGGKPPLAGVLMAGGIVVAGIAALSVAVRRGSGVPALAALVLMFALIASTLQWANYAHDPRRKADADFAAKAGEVVPPEAPLLIAQHGSLDFFKLQFYARREHRLLHNITWIRDARIKAPVVYVITRARDREYLQECVGVVEELLQTTYARRESEPGDRWTLFRVTYDPAKPRVTPEFRGDAVDVMQAMERRRGPYLGEPPAYLLEATGNL